MFDSIPPQLSSTTEETPPDVFVLVAFHFFQRSPLAFVIRFLQLLLGFPWICPTHTIAGCKIIDDRCKWALEVSQVGTHSHDYDAVEHLADRAEIVGLVDLQHYNAFARASMLVDDSNDKIYKNMKFDIWKCVRYSFKVRWLQLLGYHLRYDATAGLGECFITDDGEAVFNPPYSCTYYIWNTYSRFRTPLPMSFAPACIYFFYGDNEL